MDITKEKLVEAAVTLSTVGGGLLALGLSKDAVLKIVELPEWVFTGSVLGGILLPVAAAATFAASIAIGHISTIVAHVTYGDFDAKYLCSSAAESDLSSLHELYTTYFGADVPSERLMGEWLARCSTAFTLVRKIVDEPHASSRSELVGSFKLLPLTSKGIRALELGQATGSTFRPEHIATGAARVAGFYVGDVVATGRFARGVVIAQLNAAVVSAARGKVTVYARPLTPDGLRIMTKHGFVQLSDRVSPPAINRICRLEVEGRVEGVRRTKSRRYRLKPTHLAATTSAA